MPKKNHLKLRLNKLRHNLHSSNNNRQILDNNYKLSNNRWHSNNRNNNRNYKWSNKEKVCRVHSFNKCNKKWKKKKEKWRKKKLNWKLNLMQLNSNTLSYQILMQLLMREDKCLMAMAKALICNNHINKHQRIQWPEHHK